MIITRADTVRPQPIANGVWESRLHCVLRLDSRHSNRIQSAPIQREPQSRSRDFLANRAVPTPRPPPLPARASTAARHPQTLWGQRRAAHLRRPAVDDLPGRWCPSLPGHGGASAHAAVPARARALTGAKAPALKQGASVSDLSLSLSFLFLSLPPSLSLSLSLSLSTPRS